MGYLSAGEIGAIGTVPDQPNYDVPMNAWSWAEDVQFTPEGVVPVVQEVPAFTDTQGDIISIFRVKLGFEAEAVVYFTLTKAFVIQNSIHVEITNALGDYQADDVLAWQMAIIHGIPVFNNGTDVPQVFNPLAPESPLTDLPNWPVGLRVFVLRPYLNFLIGLGVKVPGGVYDQQGIIWSAPADPGQVPPSWDYTDPATLAGLYTFSETDDSVVDALKLGEELAIYKQRSIYGMRYVGGSFIFQIKRTPTQLGLLVPDAVCSFQNGQFFVGQSDFYVYDGIQPPFTVGEGRVRDTFFKLLSRGQKNKIFVQHDPTLKNIYIFFPTGENVWCDKALIYRYDENVWQFRNTPNVSSSTLADIERNTDQSWDDFDPTWDEDGGEWSADNSPWDLVTSWDAAPLSWIWDREEVVPITDTLLLASHVTGEVTYDPFENESTDGTLVWSGDNPHPPIWNIPIEGERKQGLLRKEGMPFTGRTINGSPEANRSMMKILTEFWPEAEYAPVELRFGEQDRPDSGITWGEWMSYDPSTDLTLYPHLTSKFIALEFRGKAADVGEDGLQMPNGWRLSGYGMEVKQGGRY